MNGPTDLSLLNSADTALDVHRPDTSGLPEALRADVDAAIGFQGASMAQSTREAYQGAWRRFLAWSRERDLDPLPATPETIAAYAANMASRGRKYSTILIAVSAIGAAHEANGFDPPPTRSSVVRTQIRGIARTIGRAQVQKREITDDVIRKWAMSFPKSVLGTRDRAMILLWFVCAARRSEMAQLEISDLDFRDEGLYVGVRRSKTDQEGFGLTKAVPYSSGGAWCPVRATKAWLDLLKEQGYERGPLFRAVRGGWILSDPLGGHAMALRIKSYCEPLGIDPATVSGHSLRAGFATSAARKGKPERQIMAQTGHKLIDTVLKYIRRANLMTETAAVGLLDG